MKCTENLVACAIEVVKAKSGAVHYEDIISFASFVGGDMGNVQHSRKQFNAILLSAVGVIDEIIDKNMSSPLSSTSFPPHFYVTCDKSTPGRTTNQAIMVCPIIDGRRTAFFIDAPKVFLS